MSFPVRPLGGERVLAPTGSESAAIDRRAIDERGVPQPVLMENAGRSAAAVVERLFPRGTVVAVVGSGNNGGDALVCVRALASWGRTVRAAVVADRPDGEPVLHGWDVERVAVRDASELDDMLADAGVVVDGILGTGIRGAPRERQAAAIGRVMAAGRPVVALDIPSGVDADSGAVPGASVRADVTVAFGWPKLGSLLHPGRARVGRLVAFEIGFPPVDDGDVTGRIVTPGWAAAHMPTRSLDTHKNDVGALLLVAGSRGMAGAAVLAGRAALRAGVGLLRIASIEANRSVIQAAAPEAVFVDAADLDALEDAVEASSAVAVGPGLGTDDRAASALGAVLEDGAGRPLLLDADALNLLAAGRPTSMADALRGRPVVLTPHPGEMERISGVAREAIRGDRIGVARRWAEEWGAVLLLKGMPSLVAASGRPVLVDSVGTSDLATGGMGDVLSGTVGAFLAQGADPRTAAGLGLHVSGRAAVRARRGAGLVPGDVVEALPGARSETGNGSTDLDLPGLVFDQDPAR